jgi:hypothetical protein
LDGSKNARFTTERFAVVRNKNLLQFGFQNNQWPSKNIHNKLTTTKCKNMKHLFFYSPDPDDLTSGNSTDTVDEESTTGDSSSVNIHYDVSLVPQPDNYTCWAASSSMILTYWKDVETGSSNPSYTVQEIKDMVAAGGPQYNVSKGLKPEDTQAVGDILGLAFDYPMCYGVDGFASLLTDKGPIVFIRASVGGKGAHAIAIIGMNGDGTPDGTNVEILNPSPVGSGAAQTVTFTDLMTKMEQLGFWDQTDWSSVGGLDRVYVMYKK